MTARRSWASSGIRLNLTTDRRLQSSVVTCNRSPGLDEDLREGTTFNGDQINNYGPVGAVGRGAQGVVNVNEHWAGIRGQVDLGVLAVELEELRNQYRNRHTSREDDRQLALLAEAVEAAESGDEEGVVSRLARVGKKVLDTATDIGTDLAAKVIAEMIKR
jgi:hypothetical protein